MLVFIIKSHNIWDEKFPFTYLINYKCLFGLGGYNKYICKFKKKNKPKYFVISSNHKES